MLVGGDLGFSYLVLLVVVFFTGPVIGGLVVRRKWRHSVARREEIKRLLVLASEEAARAELEASNGYVTLGPAIPRQLQYQCTVCYSPTTTRCARCKAVRYCSGKCQIIHWRQGHKEKCRPFMTAHQNNDVENGSSQKGNNQAEYEAYEPEVGQCAEPVDTFPEALAFSNSSGSSHVWSGKDDINIEHPEDDNRVGGSSHPESVDGHHSNNNVADKLETTYANNLSQTGSPLSKNSPLVNSLDSFTSLAKLNEIKGDCIDGDSHCGSSSSSGWTGDGSNDSLFSEPSTPSSGFWEGTIDPSRSRKDGPNDSSESTSSEAGDASMFDFQSSLRFRHNLARDADIQGPDAKTILSGDTRATNMATKIAETSKDDSKTRKSPSFSSEMSFCKDNDSGSHSHTLKNRGHNSFSSSASLANGMSSASHTLKAREMGSLSSKASDTHSSSSIGKHSVSSEKSGKVDSARLVDANSSSNGLKTSTRKVIDQFRSSKLSHPYQLGAGNEITGRYSNKGLFSYELFVKLYNCNKVELCPCGLINCGNSCYANAVLQCLAFTPPLTAYLLEGLHSKACEKKRWCFTCEFESLIHKVKVGNSPLSPIGILSQIQNIGSNLGSGREEDAHEFLRCAIDTMQNVCLKEAGVNAIGSHEDETTLIGLTFGGYLRSKIKCMKCGGKSECHEKMMDLTVEIEGDIETLEEALRKFTGTEILDGENKYHCSRCKSYERAKKRLTILEAPNVLTIALKRFQSGKFGKLNKRIRFPEILDLAPCMSGTSDKSPVYRLYGVVVHLDVMNAAFSGHYVCYVKNIQNQWFKIDDSTVKAVEIEKVLTKGAYMLLYARCSPRAPRLIRNSIICRDTRKLKSPSFKLRSHLPDSNGQANVKPFYTNHTGFHRIRTPFEEDSSSENSSSACFSEEGSSTTDSTRGSSSADEFSDQMLGDLGHNWRNSSDSDTSSSSSSSSSFPSPLYSRHSPLSDLDRYSSGYPETSGSNVEIAEDLGLRARLPSREGKGSDRFLYSDSPDQCRKLGSSSSSCRETDSERLGRVNPFDDIKSGGAPVRRSTKERTT